MPPWRPFAQFAASDDPDRDVEIETCPRFAFAPRTRAGAAALDVALDWGVWARAGLGPVSGLLIAEALARVTDPDLADGRPRAALIAALRLVETGRMEGEGIRAARDKDTET